jgi:predicted enzyme involved in methoxymalonyl-ACP biosynthesis
MELRNQGITDVKSEYIPTAKNVQVKDFYDRCGFPLVAEDTDGNRSYVLDLKDADLSIKEYYHIKLK